MHVAPKYEAKLMNTVSIIIPAYNTALYIKESLESALTQTHRDFELLVVDDGSTDETPAILQNYASRDERIRVMSQQNMGAGVAINPVAKMAKGEFLLICDSDDILKPNCLAEQVAFLRANTDLAGAGCLARFMNQNGKLFWREQNPFLTRDDYARVLSSGEVIFFRHSGFIMRKAAFLQSGGYRSVPNANDIYFFNRLADVGPIITNPQELVYYRVRNGQVTTSYTNLLEPRLNWAWISACNRARRSRHPEPEYATWRQEVEAWNWWQKFIFTQTALATGYWYEAKVDLISGRKLSFFRKALLAFIVDPLRILARACQGLRCKVDKR
jgi:glycosyltransferase involved in cell wall biosynthesis